MSFSSVYLWLNFAAALVFGWGFLLAPGLFFDTVGVTATATAGEIDLRATYGGFQLGLGAILGWCLRDRSRHPAGLVAVAGVIGGLGVCRVIALGMRGFDAGMAGAAAFELLLAGLALFGLRRTPELGAAQDVAG